MRVQGFTHDVEGVKSNTCSVQQTVEITIAETGLRLRWRKVLEVLVV